jgi:outer membrane protein
VNAFLRPIAFASVVAMVASPTVIDGATVAKRVDPSPPPLTLAEAERVALANHPDIKASVFDELAATEAVNVAKAGYKPQAYGEAVQAFAPGGTRVAAYNAITDPTVVQRTAVGVGITQYISDFGRTGDLVQAAEFDARTKTAAADRTRDLVILSVTQAYFDVLRSSALLVVANETSNERRTLLHQVRALQHAGLRSTLDLAIASRDVASADQLLLEARNRRLDAFAELTEALGSSDYLIYRLADVDRLPEVPADFTALEAAAANENPQFLETQAAEYAAQERERAAARLAAPTITGYGFFGGAPFRESNVSFPSPYAVAGVNLTVPIYTGGAIGAQRLQAREAAAAAYDASVAVRNRLLRDVRIAYEDVKTARGNVDVSDRLLQTADEALHDTTVRYRIGLSTIVDVSEAELARTQAAIAETNARYDFVLRNAELEFAAGLIASGLPPPDTNPPQ